MKTTEEILDEMERKREAKKRYAERFRRRDLNENIDGEKLNYYEKKRLNIIPS